MLFGRDARKRLEPVRVMRGAMLDCPRLHRMSDRVRDVEIERLPVFDSLAELLVDIRGKILLSHVVGENQCAESFGKLGHSSLLASRMRRGAQPTLLM